MDFFDDFDMDVAMEHRICSQYLIRLKPTFSYVARGTKYDEPYPEFEQTFIDELFEQLYTYSKKIYIMERDGRIWAFVPSMFFSSAMVFALRFDIDAGVALRCLSQSAYNDLLEYSRGISVKKSRSTRVGEITERIETILSRLNECFLEPYASCDEPTSIMREFVRIGRGISALTGTPANMKVYEPDGEQVVSGEIDFPLLSAFLLTLMLLSREAALDRCIRLSFRMLSQSVVAVAQICADESDFTRAISLWDGICADMLMPFGAFFKDGTLRLGIQPCRRELSYLGLKQETDWIIL